MKDVVKHLTKKAKPSDLKKDLAGFPLEVVTRMVREQVLQGNSIDVSIFQRMRSTDVEGGGFNWYESSDGKIFWDEVISKRNFKLFFEKYGKKSRTLNKKNKPL